MQRAVISISSNIAEGCSRKSNLELKRFLEIAKGSCFELESQLLVSTRLGYVSPDEIKTELDLLEMIQKKIYRFVQNMK